jgi:hypothetical protein
VTALAQSKFDWGIAWQLRFEEGENKFFVFGGGWIVVAFGDHDKSIPPTGLAPRQHCNQQVPALGRWKSTMGLRGGFVSRMGKMYYFCVWGVGYSWHFAATTQWNKTMPPPSLYRSSPHFPHDICMDYSKTI